MKRLVLVLLCAQACAPPPDEGEPEPTEDPAPGEQGTQPRPPGRDADVGPEAAPSADASGAPTDGSRGSDAGPASDTRAADARGDTTADVTPAQGKYNAVVKPIFGWDASDFDYGRG